MVAPMEVQQPTEELAWVQQAVAVDAAAEVYLRMIFWASSGKDPTSSSETKILGSSGEGGANQKAFSFFFSNLRLSRLT